MKFYSTYKKTSLIFGFVVSFMLLFSACNNDDDTYLSISLNNTEVSSNESSQFLKIETDANVMWTASVTEGSEWCLLTPATGTSSGVSVISVTENNSTNARTATISVHAGNSVRTITLTQQKTALLSVTVDKTEIASTASTVTITVKTKDAWTATITDGSSFCNATPTSGTGNASISAAFTVNSGNERTATIKVSTATDAVEVNIKQLKQGDTPDGRRPEQFVPNRIEIPAVVNKRWYVQHSSYEMEYDTAQKHSVWIAYVLNASLLKKNVSRSDAWAQDPEIPFQFASQRSDFYGYDRGHLIPSADRLSTLEYNKETFYYSNMSPQVGAFNQQIWANLEDKVRAWAASCDTLYIVTGGAINQGIEVIGHSAGGVTIPKYYFKALVQRKGNAFDGIAFWLENRAYSPNKITHSYSITIRELEQKTGINFFPNLPDATENAVETTRNIAKWPL